MAYSDFDLRRVQTDLGVTITQGSFIPNLAPVTPDRLLQATLDENLPLVLARGKEKARSEWIISPVLTAVRRLLQQQISLFSGDEFNVDSALGLNGYVDFLISRSPQLLLIEAPVLCIVEAKKEDLNNGLGQCIAEMVAAQIFNTTNRTPVSAIYGSVTSGTAWKFLQLQEKTVVVDLAEYPLPPVETILGILLWMVQSTNTPSA